jgi:hypothetical protein
MLVAKKRNYYGEMEVDVQYTYDEHGNLIKEKRGASESADEIQYTYDAFGKLIQSCYIDFIRNDDSSYDDVKTYTNYTYDEDGNLRKESCDYTHTYSDYLAFYCPKDTK